MTRKGQMIFSTENSVGKRLQVYANSITDLEKCPVVEEVVENLDKYGTEGLIIIMNGVELNPEGKRAFHSALRTYFYAS